MNFSLKNEKMYKRLKSAKPTYSYMRFKIDYEQNQYLEKQIKFKNNNPNIFFKTPEKFQKTLYFKLNNDLNQTHNFFLPKNKSKDFENFSSSSTFYKTRPFTSTVGMEGFNSKSSRIQIQK